MALTDWPAAAEPERFGGLQELRVGTETFAPGVRAGDVHDVLAYVATQLDARVEKVSYPGGHPADDWGWNYRPNKNNPKSISTHARGIAFDYNATRHPNGRHGTFSEEQVAELRRILTEVGGLVEWGGDFPTPDEMHFELDTAASPQQVAAVARRLRGEDDDMKADERAALFYLVGQVHGQDTPQGGWKTNDGQVRTLVDLARGAYEHAVALEARLARVEAALKRSAT